MVRRDAEVAHADQSSQSDQSDQAARDRQFIEHLEWASSIVSHWPAWKRNILQHSYKPMNSVRREPFPERSTSIPTTTQPTVQTTVPKESPHMRSRLFVIKRRGQNQYWNNSAEHGCGWNDSHPKQSFSPSELTAQIRLLIDQGRFVQCEIIELQLPATISDGTDARKEIGA